MNMKDSNGKIYQNVILIICSIVFSLYLLEGIVSIVSLINYISAPRETGKMRRIKLAKELGRDFDERSKKEVVNDLRSQGIEAYPVLAPSFLIEDNPEQNFLPTSTISQKVLVMDNEDGNFYTFTSDKHGFHNPPGSWGEEKTDILLIGDSFAMGANICPGKNIRSQLATHENKVISLGMNGTGPLLSLASLIEYGNHLKPKIVLWLYFEGNDLLDLRKERYTLFKNYLNDNFSQKLLQRQREIDALYKEFYDSYTKNPVRKNYFSFDNIKRNFFEFIYMDNLRNRLNILNRDVPLMEPILRKAKNVTSSWGGDLYFVYLPEYERYYEDWDDDYKGKANLLFLVEEIDIPIIDFDEAIKEQKDPMDLFPLRFGGHYNKTGYQLLAQTIMNKLIEDNIAQDNRIKDECEL